MSKKTIILPRYATEESISPVLRLLTATEDATEIDVDMSRVKFYIPAAVVALISAGVRLTRDGKTVRLVNAETSDAFRYLQRMDFFTQLGVRLPEDFRRHDAGGRFMPIERITFGEGDVSDIASRLAGCVVPGGDFFDDTYRLVQYAAGEVVGNARQHSSGVAFVSAQYTPHDRMIRIGIADDGIGIRESFRGTPFFDDVPTDCAAIRKALEPNVSSALFRPSLYQRPSNRGVGLSVLSELVAQSLGYLLIVSHSGWCFKNGRNDAIFKDQPTCIHRGTLLATAFRRDEIGQYAEMHELALVKLGLKKVSDTGTLFSS